MKVNNQVNFGMAVKVFKPQQISMLAEDVLKTTENLLYRNYPESNFNLRIFRDKPSLSTVMFQPKFDQEYLLIEIEKTPKTFWEKLKSFFYVLGSDVVLPVSKSQELMEFNIKTSVGEALRRNSR